MRKVLILTMVTIFMMASTAMAVELKVGVVDMKVISSNSEPAKDAKTKMESKYGPQRKQFEKQYQDLQKKAADFQKNASKEKQTELERLQREFEEKYRTTTQKLQEDEAKITQEMYELFYKAAGAVASRKGLDLVVETGGVLFAKKSMNLTQEVLEEVNKIWKADKSKK